MENIEYKSNSNVSKERQKEEHIEKRAEKVIKGNVDIKPQSKLNKFAGEIISEDAKNVKSYVFGEVLIPAIKKAISDIITNGIDIILYGETRGSKKNNKIYDRVSYNRYADDYDRDYRPRTRTAYNSYSYNDIKFDYRTDAEEVLDRMDELMSTYGLVRVADLYDLVGGTGNYTDNKYGWTNIRSAEIVRDRDCYRIKLPRAIPID